MCQLHTRKGDEIRRSESRVLCRSVKMEGSVEECRFAWAGNTSSSLLPRKTVLWVSAEEDLQEEGGDAMELACVLNDDRRL